MAGARLGHGLSRLVGGWVLAALAVLGLVCPSAMGGPGEAAKDTQRDQVLTTTYPLAYFAERIAGGLTGVECPVPASEDPAKWQPSRDVLKRFQRAELIVINGAAFEQWIPTASLPMSRTVDTAKGFESEFITMKAVTHSHGAQGAHTHSGTDGHTWLDPENAVRQSEAILRAMQKRWPNHGKAFGENQAKLAEDLRATCKLSVSEQVVSKVAVFASHPAYNYLARRLKFEVTNVDLPPDSDPSAEQWRALEAALPGDRPAIVLFETEPLARTASRLRDVMHVEPVVFSPTETHTAGEPDYLASMRENFKRLSAAIEGAASRKPASTSKTAH